MRLRCGNCGYEWEYKGRGYYATCPKCRWKVSTRPGTERKRRKFEPVEFVENYLNQRDWKVRENANIPFSFSSLFLQGANEVITEYVLKRVYPPEISRAHIEGDFHIHNIGWGIIGYCFDEETRVLTEEGFKYFRDVRPTDRVATLNLNTGELEYQHPLAKQVFEYKGTMLRWRGRNVDLMVTPEHRMLVRMPTSRSSPRGAVSHLGKVHHTSGLKSRTVTPWKFVSAGELAKRRASIEFKKDARWRGTNHPFIEFTKSRFKCQKCKCWVPAKTSTCPKCGSNKIENLTEIKRFPIEPFLRFLGWYIAEGNVDVSKGGYRISIACLKSTNRKRIASIIRQLGLRPIIGKYHVVTHSKELYSYLLPLGKSKEKYIPQEIKKLSPRLIEIFLTELFRGDGRISNGKLKYYYTRSRKLAEDVVECLIKIGKCGTIGKDKKGGYVVSVIHKSLTPEFRGGPEYVPYEGKVYDLTVPNGTLLVERNGRVVWSGNCAGWSIKDLLLMGFGGVPARTESSPPKHFSSALLQISNFLGSIQNEWAGAQAINALDVYLAPFIRKDGLGFEEIKQRIQEFIYNLNISSRWGGQTPFTNVTLEVKVPEDMKSEPIIIGGKLLDETYGDYQQEVDLFNKAFLEVLLEGDARGRVFTFPIPTVNLTPDFPWDSEVSDLLFKVTAKFGSFYFQNCIRGGLNPRDIRALCCRLQLDLRELYRRYGFFGYADKTGSVGVVTINMPRIGFLSKDEKDFFERLDRLLELAKRSLEIKRRMVEKLMKEGLLPFSARYLGSLRWHFSTIGLIGMHEACLNFLGEGIETKQGKEFAIKVLKHMRERIREFQEETGNLYNLEATPAEGASYRLARLDKERFPKIKTAGKDVPYYTNSTWLPVGYTNNLAEALRHQEDLQILYNGGTVFHAFLGESPHPSACKLLVKRIAENFAIPYYTLTPTFSICPDHGYLSGEHWNCPTCGKPCEVYSRIVGYYRPVQNWHIGKQEEFRERLEYLPSL
jgi:ribonucleoside-triphosphate reductase